MNVVVVGDLLLDEDVDGRTDRLCPDAPAPVLEVAAESARPGGAGLAAVLLAAGEGVDLALVTALDDDGAARRLRRMLAGCVALHAGPAGGGTAVKTRLRAEGRVLLRADRGRGRAAPDLGARLGAALGGALSPTPDGVLVSDYGRGVSADPQVRDAVQHTTAPVVWDPHPNGTVPVPGCTVVTPNLSEACAVLGVPAPAADDTDAVLGLAGALRVQWQADAVVITLGARGAALHDGHHPVVVPAPPAPDGDPCGAGDRFAGCLTAALAAGTSLDRAVRDGVAAASAFVARGGAGAVRRVDRGWGQPSPAGVAGPG